MKHLSVHLENAQSQRQSTSSPKTLLFYIRNRDAKIQQDTLKLIRIHINGNPDTKQIIQSILRTCSLSTEYVDNIKSTKPPKSSLGSQTRPGTDTFYGQRSPFSDEYEIKEKIKKAKQEKTMR